MYEGAFAEYYAKLHVARIAASRGDPNLDAYIASAESAYQYALAYVPQKDFNPSLVIDPYSAYQFANAAVSIGKDIIGATSWAVAPITGRLGGPQHRGVVDDIIENVEDIWGTGYYAKKEVQIMTTGGVKSSRFADVGLFDSSGNLVAINQVGISTQNGLPIGRERQAINDIYEYGFYQGQPFEGPIFFFPYK